MLVLSHQGGGAMVQDNRIGQPMNGLGVAPAKLAWTHMSQNLWLYWQPERVKQHQGDQFVCVMFGFKQRIDPGDTIWLITWENNEVFLVGKMTVGVVTTSSTKAAEAILPHRPWNRQQWPPPFPAPRRARPANDFDYENMRYILAQPGTEEPYRVGLGLN